MCSKNSNILQNSIHILISHVFYSKNMYHLYFAYICQESPERRNKNSKSHDRLVRFGFSVFFLPRSNMSHVFLIYLSLKFEKGGKTQQKFKIP